MTTHQRAEQPYASAHGTQRRRSSRRALPTASSTGPAAARHGSTSRDAQEHERADDAACPATPGPPAPAGRLAFVISRAIFRLRSQHAQH